MNDFVFGEGAEPEREPRVKIVWPLHPINQIEGDLNGAMHEALSLVEYRAPMIFIEDDEFANAAEYAELYGEELTAREAIELQKLVNAEVTEQFRRAMIVARECGERATLADYVSACAAEEDFPPSR